MLCFPFIFRGALDVGATTINEEMKLAAVRAIAELAQAEQSDVVAPAYGDAGPALRPRLPDPAALRPAPDRRSRAGGGEGGDGQRRRDPADRRHRRLPALAAAVRLPLRHGHAAGVRRAAKRRGRSAIVYAEGEDERVLRAAQVVVDEGLAQPVLVGRPDVIAQQIETLGLRLEPGRDCEIVDSRRRTGPAPKRRPSILPAGSAAAACRATIARGGDAHATRTLIAAMLLRRGEADAHAVRHVRRLCGAT